MTVAEIFIRTGNTSIFSCFRNGGRKICLEIIIDEPVEFNLTLSTGQLIQKKLLDTLEVPFNECFIVKIDSVIGFIFNGEDMTFKADEHLNGIHCNFHLYMRTWILCHGYGVKCTDGIFGTICVEYGKPSNVH